VDRSEHQVTFFFLARLMARSIAFSYSVTKVPVISLMLSAKADRMNGCARIFSVPNSRKRQCLVSLPGKFSYCEDFALPPAPPMTPTRNIKSPVVLNLRPDQRSV